MVRGWASSRGHSRGNDEVYVDNTRILAQPRCYRWEAGNVDAVTGGFGDEGKRVGALAHAAERP